MRRYAKAFFITLFCAIFFPSTCLADTGLLLLPLSAFVVPPALILVILIESWVFGRALRYAYGKTVLAVGSANLASTILGYPLSLTLLVATMGIAEKRAGFVSGPPVPLPGFGPAIAVATVAAFFVSVHCEYFIIRSFFRTEDRRRLKHLSYEANLTTYALLLAIFLGILFFGSQPA